MYRQIVFILLGLLFTIQISAQSKVSGRILDSTGQPLSFVAIEVVGTTTGAYSEDDGTYVISYSGDSQKLRFSFIGYKTQEYDINGQAIIDVVMTEDSEILDEVVVVGYGVQKKSDITGAVSIVKVDEAKLVPTTNVAELLRGKSAGVQVSLNDPSPGGKSSILIRGQNSILGNNEPLFIVDGIPTDNINGINSEDVKSIEVLKDASAQAIYGARASNGVILVTTKRGEAGSFKVAYHGYTGTQRLTKNFDLFSGEEWMQMRREAFRTDNNDEFEAEDFVFTNTQLALYDKIKKGNASFANWEDETINDATQQSHSITLSGGSENTQLLTSFGYFDQKGILIGSGYKRGTARFNIDHKISDKFKIGANIYLLTDKRDKESGSLNYITLPPLAVVRDEHGELVRYPLGDEKNTNPLWNLRESTNELFTDQFQMTFFGEYEFFKNFKYRLNSYVSRRNRQGGSYKSRLHSSSKSNNGSATALSNSKEEYLIENIFTYDYDINDNNRVDFTFLQSVNEQEYQSHSVTATNFTNDLLGYHGIESAAEYTNVKRYDERRALLSFMGRIRYYLNNKYLFTLTGRRDGSSVFGPKNKWGFFPSAAFAWKAHLEPWMQKFDFINEFKVRASYGSIGNQAIKPYETSGKASTLNYIVDDVVYGGYLPGSRLFNPDLKWETSTTFNIGIDFGLYNNLFVGNFEVYSTDTRDLLIDRTTPGGTGYSSIISNIGKVRNSGVELGITANIIRNKKIDWSITSTFSKNDNVILDLFGEVDSLGNLLDDISKNRFIGQPINVYRHYVADGIWKSEEEISGSHSPDAKPGEIRVKDINGDGKITIDDKVITKRSADWFGSLSSKFSFGAFDVFADFYTVQGAVRSNTYLAGYNEGGTLKGGLNGIKRDYWLPENPNGTYPRPRASQASPYLYDAAVKDASYVRLRTLSLAFHIPKSLLKKVKLADVTIYGTASNIITWTNYLSYSPELNVGGYPDGKSFIFGVKITN